MSMNPEYRGQETFKRFISAVENFAASEHGFKAKWMLLALLSLVFASNGMSVVNSYVGRDFMTAIADRDRAGFVHFAWVFIAVFAASTLVSVFAKFFEDRLALLWRGFLTRRLVEYYFADGGYYRFESTGELSNPDQRIAEDVRSLTQTSLSFLSMFLNSAITILAFSGVVWSISPLLFVVAVVYAALGSFATIYLGQPLISLNYDQLDKDANFRSTLLHVRGNAEGIKLAQRENLLMQKLYDCFVEVVTNLKKIIAVNRNLGLFTGLYYWMIGLIPALIVAPDYFDGKVEFGVVTQAAQAFSALVGAFSLVVTQFQSISNFGAVVSRVYDLGLAIEKPPSTEDSALQSRVDEEAISLENLTLYPAKDGIALLTGLNLHIPTGSSVLIRSGNELKLETLFRALAGLPVKGSGAIGKPQFPEIVFVSRRPYGLPCTLRQMIVPHFVAAKLSNEALNAVLADFGLESLLEKADGLDVVQDFSELLSLVELQLLALVRVLLAKPRFVVLDQLEDLLDADQINRILLKLQAADITYVYLGNRAMEPGYFHQVLEL